MSPHICIREPPRSRCRPLRMTQSVLIYVARPGGLPNCTCNHVCFTRTSQAFPPRWDVVMKYMNSYLKVKMGRTLGGSTVVNPVVTQLKKGFVSLTGCPALCIFEVCGIIGKGDMRGVEHACTNCHHPPSQLCSACSMVALSLCHTCWLECTFVSVASCSFTTTNPLLFLFFFPIQTLQTFSGPCIPGPYWPHLLPTSKRSGAWCNKCREACSGARRSNYCALMAGG